MVAYTLAGALLELFSAGDTPGFPWACQPWQTRTQIFHGLFPVSDDDLVPEFTRDDADAVQSFFDAWRAKPTREDRHAFLQSRSTDSHTGRQIWKDFVSARKKSWGISQSITAAFEADSITPFQLMIRGKSNTVPHAIPVDDAFDSIAYNLFGADGLDDSGKAKLALRSPMRKMALITANNLKRATISAVERFYKHKASIDALLDAFSQRDPTEQELKVLTKEVRNWKAIVKLWPSPDNLAAEEDIDAEMAEIASGLGGVVESGALLPPRKKATKIKSSKIAKAQGESRSRQEILCMVEALFAPDADIPELVTPIDVSFGEMEDGFDPGVAVEAKMTFGEICANLGLDTSGRHRLMNDLLHTGPVRRNEWVDGELFSAFRTQGDKHPESDDFAELRPHFHQIQALHSVVRQFFTEKRDLSNGLGVAVTDVPGLGKTLTSLSIVTFLISVGMRQDIKIALPPLLQSRPFLGSVDTVPNLPSVIIAPVTLVEQWVTESLAFIKPNTVRFFRYPTSKPARKKFFAADSEYSTCDLDLRSRIILASQSTVFTEFRELFQHRSPSSKASPWVVPPPRRPAYNANASSTLFGQRYLCLVLDEAHFCRNPGSSHWSALEMSRLSQTRLILTATPIQTRTEDIGAIGRLANIKHFSSQAYADELASDATDLRRAKQDSNSPGRAAELQVKASRRMQGQFGGALISRTLQSLGMDGKPIIDPPLPEKTVHYVLLTLQQWEADFVEMSLTEESFDDILLAQSLNVQTESLFTLERMMVTLPGDFTKKSIPSIKSQRQWEDLGKPTKIDTVCRLVKYLLSGDDAPSPIVHPRGGITFPSYEPKSGTPKTMKIIIFQEFPIYMPVVSDALQVFGINAATLNGSMNYASRNNVIRRFKEKPQIRCLVMSKVGAVGLNLTVASTLIFLDQQWSFADENQAIGRIYRQGQTRPVVVYHMLAAGTVDYYMAASARGKEKMSQAFTMTEKQKKLESIIMRKPVDFNGAEDHVEVTSDEEGEGASKKPKKSKKSKKGGKEPARAPNRKGSATTASNKTGGGVQASIQAPKQLDKKGQKSQRQKIVSEPTVSGSAPERAAERESQASDPAASTGAAPQPRRLPHSKASFPNDGRDSDRSSPLIHEQDHRSQTCDDKDGGTDDDGGAVDDDGDRGDNEERSGGVASGPMEGIEFGNDSEASQSLFYPPKSIVDSVSRAASDLDDLDISLSFIEVSDASPGSGADFDEAMEVPVHEGMQSAPASKKRPRADSVQQVEALSPPSRHHAEPKRRKQHTSPQQQIRPAPTPSVKNIAPPSLSRPPADKRLFPRARTERDYQASRLEVLEKLKGRPPSSSSSSDIDVDENKEEDWQGGALSRPSAAKESESAPATRQPAPQPSGRASHRPDTETAHVIPAKSSFKASRDQHPQSSGSSTRETVAKNLMERRVLSSRSQGELPSDPSSSRAVQSAPPGGRTQLSAIGRGGAPPPAQSGGKSRRKMPVLANPFASSSKKGKM